VNKRLYVGNLNYSTTDEELKEYFSTEGNVVYSKVINGTDGRSRGFGFVEMETEEEAQKAIEKFNQSTFKDRTIVVNEAREREDRDKFRGNRDQNRDSFRDRKDKDNLDSKLRQLRKKFNK